ELPEALDVLERDGGLAKALVLRVDRLDTCQMQTRIEEHGGMPVGEHEPVAVRPDRVFGVEAQKTLPQGVDHRCECHRRAGMAGLRLLHGIHREGADRVDAKLVDRASEFRFHAEIEATAPARSPPAVESRDRRAESDSSRAVFTSATWVSACGKLPSMRRVSGSYSSGSRPTSLLSESSRSKSASASSWRPSSAKLSASQNEQGKNVPSPGGRPSTRLAAE